jgi:hypothetical protein
MSKTFVTTLSNPNQTITYVNTLGQTVTTGRSMEVRVIVPDAAGDYPIVFYSHGHTAVPAGTGSSNAKALADLGYIVILPTHLDSLANPQAVRDAYPFDNAASTLHRVADMKYAFDQLPVLMALAPGYTADTATPVMAGHSHGSWTTSLLTGVVPQDTAYTALPSGNPYGLTSLVDARFKASMVLSPPGVTAIADAGPGFDGTSWNGYQMPSILITGTLDERGPLQDYRWRLEGIESAPSTGKHAVVLRDADHFQIGGFSASTAQTAAIVSAMDAFLDAYVRGEPNRLLDPATVLNSNSLYSEVLVKTSTATAGEMRGTESAEQIAGYDTPDLISGFDGADSLSGLGGNDTLVGGSGADQLNGGDGFDFVSYYTATFGVSVDLLYPILNSGDAIGDTFTSIEAIVGSNFADGLFGTETADVMYGAAGDDVMYGRAGDDVLLGTSGNDTMAGGQGDDTYYGTDYVSLDNDQLLIEGTTFGKDLFQGFGSNPGANHDVIRFLNGPFADFADVFANSHQFGTDVVITKDWTNWIVLVAVNKAELSADDFLFG